MANLSDRSSGTSHRLHSRQSAGTPATATWFSRTSRTTLPSCTSDSGLCVQQEDPPVTLETINTSPRVFRIRNFLSDAEAEDIVEETMSISDDMYKLQRSGTGKQQAAQLQSSERSEWRA